MAIRVNPNLILEIERYGAEDVQKCYHCGNCSAVCTHADSDFLFPRKSMRQLQMGLERRIEASLEPWLCYYCGQCSAQCPRGAEPGETMMSLRRWLTARYDVTGISGLFYRSWKAELLAIVLVAFATCAGFLAWGFSAGDIRAYDGPTAFLPSATVHVFDWVLAIVLAGILGINAARMWWFTTGSGARVRPGLLSYLRKLHLLPFHFITQKRYALCESKRPWAAHLVMVLSYLTMLVLIMFFLHAMQSGPQIRWPAHAFGYLASAGLLGTLSLALWSRVKRNGPQFKHSHESDWIFLILLLIVTATGVAQHVLHRAGPPLAANVAYVVHLSFVVPMLVLEVPFSKWAHMAYRPLAVWLAEVQKDALARKRSAEAGVALVPRPRAA